MIFTGRITSPHITSLEIPFVHWNRTLSDPESGTLSPMFYKYLWYGTHQISQWLSVDVSVSPSTLWEPHGQIWCLIQHPQTLVQCQFIKATTEEEYTHERHSPCLPEVQSGVIKIENHLQGNTVYSRLVGKDEKKSPLEWVLSELSSGEWMRGSPQKEGDE